MPLGKQVGEFEGAHTSVTTEFIGEQIRYTGNMEGKFKGFAGDGTFIWTQVYTGGLDEWVYPIKYEGVIMTTDGKNEQFWGFGTCGRLRDESGQMESAKWIYLGCFYMDGRTVGIEHEWNFETGKVKGKVFEWNYGG